MKGTSDLGFQRSQAWIDDSTAWGWGAGDTGIPGKVFHRPRYSHPTPDFKNENVLSIFRSSQDRETPAWGSQAYLHLDKAFLQV